MEYDRDAERATIIEARLSFCEQRIAALERYLGGIIKVARRPKKPLTPEEKKAVRERLMKGQEAARARREAEAKAQAKKEKADGAPATAD
jgi:hypothetical protein